MPLRVLQAFGGHAIGDEITDDAATAAVLDSEQAHFVVRVPDAEPAEPASASDHQE